MLTITIISTIIIIITSSLFVKGLDEYRSMLGGADLPTSAVSLDLSRNSAIVSQSKGQIE
jgi:hypothetical protein